MSTLFRKPDQIIQPFHFGEPVKKTTCLWLRGLTPLFSYANAPLFAPDASQVVEPRIITLANGARYSAWDYELSKRHKTRARLRSVTFKGIAEAMASQWG